jgi:hypothetical protein
MNTINIYRGKDGLIKWAPPKEGDTIVAAVPTYEAAKSAVRLLSMGEIFDGRMNVNGKLVPLTEEQSRVYYSNYYEQKHD